MAAEALKLMGDLKAKMEELGLILSDAQTALQDEKTASYAEGVAAGKAEGGVVAAPVEGEPGEVVVPTPVVDVEPIKAELEVAKLALEKLQAKYDALLAAVDVEIEDAKIDSARLEKAKAGLVEAPAVEAPVEGEAPEVEAQA